MYTRRAPCECNLSVVYVDTQTCICMLEMEELYKKIFFYGNSCKVDPISLGNQGN